MSTPRRKDSHFDLAAEGRLNTSAVVTLPAKRLPVVIRASAVTSANYDANPINVDVFKSRRVYLHIAITAGAAGDIVSIVPEMSGGSVADDNKGSPSPDSWFPLSDTDDPTTVTNNNLDASLGSATGYLSTNFRTRVYRPLDIRNVAASGAGSIRMVIPLDVEGAKYFRVRVAAIAGTPSVELRVSKSA